MYTIKKRDGSMAAFDQSKITQAIFKAAQSVGRQDLVFAQALSDKVIQQLRKSYREDHRLTVEEIQDEVEKVLIQEGQVKIAKNYILYRHDRMKLREEKASLIGRIGGKTLSLNALKVLKERYLLRDKEGNLIETPEEMFRRVAMSVAKAEPPGRQKEMADQFYQMLVHLDFLPNSPCLMNAGTPLQQLAACFVLPIKDSIDDIYQTLRHAMIIQKTAGGTGFNFSHVRPRNSLVQSTKGHASGPVSFLHVYNAATEAIKHGGKKRGANMGVLRVDHPDILEFIHCKDKSNALRNFNVSVMVTDQFMKAAKKNADYPMVDPTSGQELGKQSARYVFDSMVTSAWQNGDPGILFLDRINKDNPTPGEGRLEATNPCAELPLLDYEACTLGSINMGNFVENKKVDWKRLQQTIWLAVRFLDNVIDVNNYPLSEIKEQVMKNRKIGLGMMGFADMLAKLRIPYNSKEGVKMAEELGRFLRKEADAASMKLAEERGVFPNWEQSIYNKKSEHFRGQHLELRNATRLSIAPTGSLSMIADCSAGIEPLFALSYMKKVLGGKEFFYVDQNFKDALDEKGLKSEEIVEHIINKGSIQDLEDIPQTIRKVFVTAHDISPEWHVKIQAAFQNYVDNAISKTVNFPNSATIRDVEEVYMMAWKMGCKGITLYRDNSKSEQVIHLTTH
jgi:ribonucleoside-diphosphate reductase alpha chain